MDAEFESYKKSMKLTNFVIGGKLNLDMVNVEEIARNHHGVKYETSVFSALVFIIKDPRTTCSLYPNGRFASMGAQTMEEAILAVRKHELILNTVFGLKCRCNGSYIGNVVANVHLFPINLDLLHTRWSNLFPPRGTFPGIYLKCNLIVKTNIVMAIFKSGNVNIMGSENPSEVYDVFKLVYFQFLIHVRTIPIEKDESSSSSQKSFFKYDKGEDNQEEEEGSEYDQDEIEFMQQVVNQGYENQKDIDADISNALLSIKLGFDQ